MKNQIWFQKYQIIKMLGQGGSADVYLAEHVKLKSFRAIKRISKDSILHEQLLNEAHILKNLKHSCIPVIYDFEEDAHFSYIIEQYIEGESLRVFRQHYRNLSEEIIISFTIQICDLMQYLYSVDNPILYLDLKPDNIIIAEKTVKLIDFGASSYKNQVTNRKYSLGTKGYAAPELYNGHIPDERTDVYGIGMLLFFMMTGKGLDVSIQKRLKREIIRSYSKRLQSIMNQCLHSYPFFRYSTVSVLKNKLLDIDPQKRQTIVHSNKSICFAIAGTQHRIGTTHLSIILSSYFTRKGKKGLYIEKNNSNHIFDILKKYQKINTKDGIYHIFDCNMLPAYQIDLPYKVEDYQVTVLDYGCLNQGNLEEFLQADIKLVVSGAKEWEIDETEEILRLLSDYKDIKYLFNFIDGKQFHDITRFMENLPCYRIPYEPNPFQWNNHESLDRFIEKLISS
jgi:serine/threonine protein kinase